MPEHVARAVGGDHVVDRSLGACGLETIRVRDDPRRHEAAVGTADDAEPLGVDEVVALECCVDRRHHVLVVDGPPARPLIARGSADRAAPLLAVAGGTARIRVHDGVARTRVDLELVEEARVVLRERSAVNRKQCRILRAGLEAGRANDPAIDLAAVLRTRGEPFGFDELPPIHERTAHVRQLSIAGVQLGQSCRVRRDADDGFASDVVADHDLLAADEHLRLRGAVCARGVHVNIAAVLDSEDDSVAVPDRLSDRRIRAAVEVEARRQQTRLTATGGDDRDLPVSRPVEDAGRIEECQLRTIRRPRDEIALASRRRHLRWLSPVQAHDVHVVHEPHVPVVVTLGHEGERATVRRPCGRRVLVIAVRHLSSRTRAVRRDDE